jgi:Ca-activated chloride channel homolog
MNIVEIGKKLVCWPHSQALPRRTAVSPVLNTRARKHRPVFLRGPWPLLVAGSISVLGTALLVFLSGCSSSFDHRDRKSPWPGPGVRPGIPGPYAVPPSASDNQLTGGLRNSGPALALPSADEELWVVAKGETPEATPGKDDPGTGAMLANSESIKDVPLPLKHTEVQARVSGYIATVQVIQQFHNPYDGKIEAVYVFPLPHNAAVNEFIMTIGQRRIRGIIRERKEAERIYQEAKRQGYVASLLTQERPNIFTQSVANIEPGKQIDVQITYFHTLAYHDGWYEFVFPMVVGPRYNPAGSTNGIGAVARGAQGASGHSTEVQYLKPTERSGHDIGVKVDLSPGVTIEELICRSHVIQKQAQSPEQCSVSLSPNDRIPNKDFVLRYRVAGERIKSDLLTHRDERGGFFTLMLYPPQHLKDLNRQPLEMVFVLDCSGSMSGRPLAAAKQAIDRALRHLRPEDTLQIIRFSNDASQFGPAPIEATPANVRRALDYLNSLNSEGGTEMITGIKAALDFPHDPKRLRFVCFLTDGYIGNEAEILHEIQKRLGDSRIFSFGIGSAVNRYLIEHMAKVGRGAMAYLGPNDSAAQIMDDFLERISHPAMSDLKMDWGGLQVSEVFPKRLPDLFVGRSVVITGRFKGEAASSVRVTGRCGGEETSLTVAADRTADGGKALPAVWARLKIADLSDHTLADHGSELATEIKQVALDYGLMSAYTAFLAVDSSQRTEGNEGTTVPVAVPVPDGVKYDTTVKEK